eukprot:366245-Chlamydomonas_euryale.AAC.14
MQLTRLRAISRAYVARWRAGSCGTYRGSLCPPAASAASRCVPMCVRVLSIHVFGLFFMHGHVWPYVHMHVYTNVATPCKTHWLYTHLDNLTAMHVHAALRVRGTGSGSTKDMPVLSVARQRVSSSGQGAVTKGTPLRTVLSHPIPTPPHQPGRENRAQSR